MVSMTRQKILYVVTKGELGGSQKYVTDLIINLDVSDELTINRILERGKTSGRDDDASIDIINRRLETYYRETEPILSYYSDRVKTVDSNKSIFEVFNDVVQILNNQLLLVNK